MYISMNLIIIAIELWKWRYLQSTTNNLSIQLDKYKLITINQISNNSGIKKKIPEIADNRSLISLTYTGNSDKSSTIFWWWYNYG